MRGPFFGGNHEQARLTLKSFKFIPKMLSKSRLNRRIQAVPEDYWKDVLRMMVEVDNCFAVDSFPIKVCHNIRIKRCRIYQNESYRGYNASKRQYFYGLKIHVVTNRAGQVYEFYLSPASEHDVTMFKKMNLDLPENAEIYGDSAYTDYVFEDLLNAHFKFYPMRKSNAKRQFSLSRKYIQSKNRKRVETTGSLIQRLLPAKIHAVTSRGFERKVGLFVIAAAFHQFFQAL